jgi:signal transduction histidine kinase
MAISLCVAAKGQSYKIILDDNSREIAVNEVAYITDSSCAYRLDQVRSPVFQPKFSLSTATKNGFREDIYCYWIKFEVENNSWKEREWLVDFAGWSNVEFYCPDSAGGYDRKLTGHMVAFNKRDFHVANRNLVNLDLRPGDSKQFYARLATGISYMLQPDRLSFKIYTKQDVVKYESKIRNLFYFFSGIFIVMFLYNFFVYLSINEKSYLYYLFILLILQLIILANTGFNVELFKAYEGYPALVSKLDLVFSSLFGTFLLLFTRNFLKTKKNQPTVDKIFTGVIITLVLIPIPGFMGYVLQATNISSIVGLLTMIILFIASIKSCIDRYPASGFFLMAYSAILAGIFIFLSANIGLLAHTPFTDFGVPIGSCIGIVLFSFALSNSINILKKQNAEKQQQIIRHLEENASLQTKVNIELEQKVEERTREIKEFQKQLIQQEKLASLGEVTAGIAHEIQNPLNFVNNFSELNNELLAEMTDEMEKGNMGEANAIAQDVIKNGQKILNHGKRAEAIVKGMLQHSRSGGGEKQSTNLNALADEYLQLSFHGLRAKDKDFNVAMQTDFDDSVGKIDIIPQDIGRVLLNLYNNAFYAVTEKRKQLRAVTQPVGQLYQPKVSISTRKINARPDNPTARDQVEIRIRDNGNGIPQKVIDKIFQPFFTTKPTGQGTGLGLSISFDIVNAHNGQLQVNSEEGEFTEFIVTLPYQKSI